MHDGILTHPKIHDRNNERQTNLNDQIMIDTKIWIKRLPAEFQVKLIPYYLYEAQSFPDFHYIHDFHIKDQIFEMPKKQSQEAHAYF
jgi:hypothetical protein